MKHRLFASGDSRGLFCLVAFAACLTLAGCGEPAAPTMSGVRGSAHSEGKPLPAGTTLTFNSQSGADAFMTRVDDKGEYAYKPAAGVKVPTGDYVVTVTPPPARTIKIDGMDMPDPSDKTTYPQIYPKYASVKSSNLKVAVNAEETVFDINLKK